MTPELEKELEAAVKSDLPLGEIVALLRRYKEQGIAQAEVYAFLERMHHAVADEATDDRILEVADFVAGFCAPHMKIWEGDMAAPSSR
jgi:N-acetylglutamate synthase-like GNAT family acetyltransferase